MSSREKFTCFPRRDVLDDENFDRPEGALPKPYLPAWRRLPLDCRIPAVWRDHNPVLLARTLLGEPLFRDFDGKAFDCTDPNGLHLPMASEYKLHDPDSRDFLVKSDKWRYLVDDGIINEDGYVICSLKEFNEYRAYLRRLKVMEHNKKLDDEAERDLQLLKEKEKEQDEKERKRKERVAGMHRWIKEQWAGIKERSMAVQMDKDMKVINNQIRIQLLCREKNEKFKEKYVPKYTEHIGRKYKTAKVLHLERLRSMEEDIRKVQALIDKRNVKKLERQIKHDEWWQRKLKCEEAWLRLEDVTRDRMRSDSQQRIKFMNANHIHPESFMLGQQRSKSRRRNSADDGKGDVEQQTFVSEYKITLAPQSNDGRESPEELPESTASDQRSEISSATDQSKTATVDQTSAGSSVTDQSETVEDFEKLKTNAYP